MAVIELESVGTTLDLDTGMTYPTNADNTYDKESGCSLKEMNFSEDSYDWYTQLSVKDKWIVDNWLLLNEKE